MRPAASIEARGLVKFYKSTPVLRGLDLDVAAGSVHALLGPNGAGKTTTVRVLATLTAPDGGSARVAGYDVAAEPGAVRRAIGLAGQYAALDGLQTGAENLRMLGRLAGLGARAARRRADELLARFDLTGAADRRVAAYSGGMRRRLDLAAALCVAPRVLFLDEPTTGLDPASRLTLWALVSELRDGGTTVLLTTQYLEEADRLADAITVIDDGRVVAHGTAAQLKATVGERRLELRAADRAAFEELVARAGSDPAALLARDPAALTVAIAGAGTAAHQRAALDALDPQRTLIADFSVSAPTLDDVFLTLCTPTAATEAVHA